MVFPLLFGSVRHMKLIGEDPEFKALRRRNEQRLAALKANHRLYEDKREPAAATGNRLKLYANCAPIVNWDDYPALANLAGLATAGNAYGADLAGIGGTAIVAQSPLFGAIFGSGFLDR